MSRPVLLRSAVAALAVAALALTGCATGTDGADPAQTEAVDEARIHPLGFRVRHIDSVGLRDGISVGLEQVGSGAERSILLGGRSDPERDRGRLRSTGEFGDGRRGVDHETPA